MTDDNKEFNVRDLAIDREPLGKHNHAVILQVCYNSNRAFSSVISDSE